MSHTDSETLPQDVIRDTETKTPTDSAEEIGSGKVQSTGTVGATGYAGDPENKGDYATGKGANTAGETGVPHTRADLNEDTHTTSAGKDETIPNH
ncbi:MAG: hypothetical protein KY468_03640 [Armatimonadetes bacterium]|nr:hypothetical protein [Armatimonadota bacterium]